MFKKKSFETSWKSAWWLLAWVCLLLKNKAYLFQVTMFCYPLVHLQTWPVTSCTTALIELYMVQKKKKKINILQLEPTFNSSFPKSNSSSFTMMLWCWQSLILAKIRKGFFANEQKASLLLSVQRMREGKEPVSSLPVNIWTGFSKSTTQHRRKL